MAKVDLEFLARQLNRVLQEIAVLKDDATVVMARLDRIDATIDELRHLQSAPRPTLKELLLTEAPRAEIPVPPRGSTHRRPPSDRD